MTATITQASLNLGKRRGKIFQAPGVGENVFSGHLLAHVLGGSNSDPRNFVAMWHDTDLIGEVEFEGVNNGAMLFLELWSRNRANDGETICYVVMPRYMDSMNNIPASIEAVAVSSSGKGRYIHAPNPPGIFPNVGR